MAKARLKYSAFSFHFCVVKSVMIVGCFQKKQYIWSSFSDRHLGRLSRSDDQILMVFLQQLWYHSGWNIWNSVGPTDNMTSLVRIICLDTDENTRFFNALLLMIYRVPSRFLRHGQCVWFMWNGITWLCYLKCCANHSDAKFAFFEWLHIGIHYKPQRVSYTCP